MKNHTRLINLFFYLLICFFIISCGGGGGDGDSGGSTTPDTSIYSAQDWSNLYDYNAYHNSGYTIRWPNTVTTQNVLPEYFRRWEGSTEGKIQFNFVSYPPSDGISVYLGTNLSDDYAGLTVTSFRSATGEIIKATILIHPDYWNPTDAPYVLTHEAGHALGFFNHTTDGCIMDDRVGARNYISDAVARVMTHLYSYPAYTNTNNYFLKGATAQFSTVKKDDGTLIIKSPYGDFYIKQIDSETSIISNGPFYTGQTEPLTQLK